jgi:hypothetical protein
MEKLMGLLVTVIAVQLVMNGVAAFVRNLMNDQESSRHQPAYGPSCSLTRR